MSRPVSASSRATLPVFRRLVVDGWRGMIGWMLGIAFIVLLYLPLYPSMASEEMTQMMNSLPNDLIEILGYDDIASGTGYTEATFFGLLGYVLLAIAASAWGAAFIAGAEETGKLELALAHAIGRVQYALESVAAAVTKILVLSAVVFLLIRAVNEPSELGLALVNLLAITMAWASLGLLSGAAALAVGALTGRRVWAIGAGAGIAVVGYVFDAVGNSGENLQWLYTISPYHWAFGNAPLAEGFDWAGLSLLWIVCAVLIAVTTWGLARRDILG